MSKKIKFSFLKMLFRLFSFLADKTNGWKIFVQPKLLIGTLLLGVGVASCAPNQKSNTKTDTIDTTDEYVTCYDVGIDTVETVEIDTASLRTSCYDIVVPEETTTNEVYTDTIYNFVEKMPEFIGGTEALLKWLDEHIEYPFIAKEMGIQGKVFVKFVVTKTGEIANVQVVKGVHQSLNKGAMRVVKSMPKWQAGKQNGKNVNTWYTLPVSFVLK